MIVRATAAPGNERTQLKAALTGVIGGFRMAAKFLRYRKLVVSVLPQFSRAGCCRDLSVNIYDANQNSNAAAGKNMHLMSSRRMGGCPTRWLARFCGVDGTAAAEEWIYHPSRLGTTGCGTTGNRPNANSNCRAGHGSQRSRRRLDCPFRNRRSSRRRRHWRAAAPARPHGGGGGTPGKQINLSQVTQEARVKMMWGDTEQQVMGFLMVQGLAAA